MTGKKTKKKSDPEIDPNGDQQLNKADEYLAGWKRAQADLVNFRKETETRNNDIAKFASESAFLEMIEVLDNMQTALTHVPPEIQESHKDWLQGIIFVDKQFQDLFKRHGIELIETSGEFDPELHEAVQGDNETGSLIVIMQGYTMHGKIVRPARVVVPNI